MDNLVEPWIHYSVYGAIIVKDCSGTVYDLTTMYRYCPWFDDYVQVLSMIWRLCTGTVYDLTTMYRYSPWFEDYVQVLCIIWRLCI